MKISNRVILLTGATGGIGEAVARRLAAEGGHLVLNGRNRIRLDRLAAELGGKTRVVAADISTPEGRRQLAEACARLAVDTVIHNAGTQEFSLFAEQDADTIAAAIQLNLTAPMLLTRLLLPLLQQRSRGTLVFIGSTFGSIGHPGFASYCATKFGLRGFAESLRRELANSAIVVHYLAPRATRTELNSPAVVAMNLTIGNTMDDPAVVAAKLVKVLHKRRGGNSYIGWPEKLFVRLNGLLPGLVDNALKKNLATIREFAHQPQVTDRRI